MRAFFRVLEDVLLAETVSLVGVEMKKRTLGLGLVGVSLALLIAASASATVMVEFSLEEIVRSADTIVHATAIRTNVRMALTDGSMSPETVTTFEVREWIAGAGGETVQIRELGGVWQGGGLRYDGTPTYAAGEEVILFLERRPEAPHDLRTFGMVQGKFIVRHGIGGVPATVRRDLDGISFAHWADDQQTVDTPGDEAVMQLDNFLDYVRRVRADGGAL